MSYNALHLSFEGVQRRSDMSGEDAIKIIPILQASVRKLEAERSALENGLEEVGALRILTSILIEMVELHQIVVFLLLSGQFGEVVSKHREPSAEETGNMKVTLILVGLLSVFEKGTYTTIREGISFLGRSLVASWSDADIEKRSLMSTFIDHARLAGAA